jgi:hypothetical protein
MVFLLDAKLMVCTLKQTCPVENRFMNAKSSMQHAACTPGLFLMFVLSTFSESAIQLRRLQVLGDRVANNPSLAPQLGPRVCSLHAQRVRCITASPNPDDLYAYTPLCSRISWFWTWLIA